MTKANDPDQKTVHKATTSKETATVKTGQAKSDSEKKKPVAEKAKAPAKKVVNKAAASKEAGAVKTEQTKSDSAKKKPIAQEAKTSVKKVADEAEKAKGAFARKMDEVKSSAEVIGQKIADGANDANKKSESLEAAIVSGLHEMKKDIHWAAEKIAEKTKE